VLLQIVMLEQYRQEQTTRLQNFCHDFCQKKDRYNGQQVKNFEKRLSMRNTPSLPWTLTCPQGCRKFDAKYRIAPAKQKRYFEIEKAGGNCTSNQTPT